VLPQPSDAVSPEGVESRFPVHSAAHIRKDRMQASNEID